MKVHLPLFLRKALLAVLFPLTVASQAYATTTYQNATETLTFDGERFMFWDTGTLLSFQDNQDIEFINNSVSNQPGGAISTDYTVDGTPNAFVEFLRNKGDILFKNNTTTNDGGAIAGGRLGLTFEGNLGEIRFESNSAAYKNYACDGGALYGCSSNEAVFKDNRDIVFVGNMANRAGGAICTEGSVDFNGNEVINFTGNYTNTGAGGAIEAYVMNISNTSETVLFSENSAGSNGGAVYMDGSNSGNLTITENLSVVFAKNTAKQHGGAISFCSDYNKSTFDSNELIEFTGNTAGDVGGAIYFTGTHYITNNKTLNFIGNKADGKGGAIYNDGFSTIADNDVVAFLNNSAGSAGGAIYGTTALIEIEGNGSVVFRGNYVRSYAEDGTTVAGVVLNGITTVSNAAEPVDISTSTDAASTITFYDGNSFTVHNGLNRYEDADGNIVIGQGKITFSGEYAADDLKAAFVKEGLATDGALFEESLKTSLTTNIDDNAVGVYGNPTLAGGTLEVTHGAILNIVTDDWDNGHYLAAENTVTILSHGGEMNVAKNAIFRAGSALRHTEGVATLMAQNVTLTDGLLECAAQTDGYGLTIDSNLTLDNGNILITAGGEGQGMLGFDVTGTLTVTGTTTLTLDSSYNTMTGNLIVFRLNGAAGENFSGDTTTWNVGFLSAENAVSTLSSTEHGALTQMVLADGKWGIVVTLDGEEPSGPVEPDPDPEEPTPVTDIYVYPTDNIAITDLDKNVHMLGGTLDASGVDAGTPLTNGVIVESESGTVIMGADQTLALTGQDAIGYSVTGVSGASAGKVVIGQQNGTLNDAAIELNGADYDVNGLEVLSGIGFLGESSQLGNDATNITVGSALSGEDTTAGLVNDGDILADTLNVTGGGSMTNNGKLTVNTITMTGVSALGSVGELSAASVNLADSAYLENSGHMEAAAVTLADSAVMDNAGQLNAANGIKVASGAVMNNTGTIDGDVELSGVINNDGQMSGTITMLQDSTMSGTGTYGTINANGGASLEVKGKTAIDALNLADGSKLNFTVNGTTSATGTDTPEGTYAAADVKTLNIEGTPTVGISVGAGIIAAGSDTFTLNLLNAETTTGTGQFSQEVVLIGQTELLAPDYEMGWDPTTGTLTFTAKINDALASQAASSDAALLADTLWSSTAALGSFARTAVAQGKHHRAGEHHVWGAGLGTFSTMSGTGNMSGFSYNGGGYAVGADVSVSENMLLGAAFGHMVGTHKSDNSLLSDKQHSYMFALYGNYCQEVSEQQTLSLSGYFSYGKADHTAKTHIGGDWATPGHARWNDNLYTFGVTADWNIKVSESLTLAPFIGLSFMYGSPEDYTENFAGGVRDYTTGSLQTWSVPVGLTVNKRIDLSNGQMLSAYATLGYMGDISRRNPRAHTTALGHSVTGYGHAPGRHAFMGKLGLDWQINGKWSVGAHYNLEVREHQTNQSAGITATYTF